MNQDPLEILKDAAEAQPLGTCSVCHTENVHVFEGVDLKPTEEQPPQPAKPFFLCVDCFAKDGKFTDIRSPKNSVRESFISHCPNIIKFILMNTRIFFTVTTAITALLCLIAGIIEFIRDLLPLGVLFVLAAWGVVYVNTSLIDHWHKRYSDREND